jgi:hypothetical protein
VTNETPGKPSRTHAAELPLVTVTWRPRWPAELPPGAGSTTALAVLMVQRFPAEVRLPLELDEVDELDEVVELVETDAVDELGLGWGAGVGELLQAASAVAAPAAANTRHTERTERTERRPCVVTPPR